VSRRSEYTDKVLIAHMRQCLDLIDEYTAGDRSLFDSSRMIQDAVIRNLQTLTESSQRLSDSIKGSEPLISWRELAGFRNVLVHAYLGIDLETVWSVVVQDLPALASALERMARRLA
jgi:uncharacterized protein with HEPN domain